MSQKINIAIIGAGAIAKEHMRGVQCAENRCQVVAVCNQTLAKGERFAHDFGLTDCFVCTDYHDVLVRPEVDAVVICLPPRLHAEVTVAALNAKKHVLVEKPMAPSLAECDEMIAAARRNDRLLSVVCQNRYLTPMVKLKTMLERGDAGHIFHATVNSLWWRGTNYHDIWWRGTWEKEGGGCLTSHAVHHLDLMQWMLGMPERVTAMMTNLAHTNSQCEDLAMAIFEQKNRICQFTVSILNHGEGQEMIFQGERARISIPFEVQACRAMENGFPEPDEATVAELNEIYTALDALPLEGHSAQIANFLSAIEGTEPLLITGEEGRKTIELVMAIYKSAVTKMAVTLPLTPDDPFYRHETMVPQMPHYFEKQKDITHFETDTITLPRQFDK